GNLFCRFFFPGRELLRPVAILRNRFAGQNNRRISRGRTVIGARTSGRPRFRTINGRLFYRLCDLDRLRGLDLWLWALVSLTATSPTTTTASPPGPCSFLRIRVRRGRSFGLLAFRLLLR